VPRRTDKKIHDVEYSPGVIEIEVGLVAFAIYVIVSLAVGDLFPFSRYSMYASLSGREEGAVLYVRAGERFVAPDELVQVHGLDVPALDPKRVPCSQQWVVYEAQRWLETHSVADPPEHGVPVEVGYRMLKVEGDGTVSMRLAPKTAGTGRLRA
jgi:hypothetical protein